jgi:hypothetical protein
MGWRSNAWRAPLLAGVVVLPFVSGPGCGGGNSKGIPGIPINDSTKEDDRFRTTITDLTWASATTLRFHYYIEELPLKPDEFRLVFGIQGAAACCFFDDAGKELSCAGYTFGWGERGEGRTHRGEKMVTVEVPRGATKIIVRCWRDLNTEAVRLPERPRS